MLKAENFDLGFTELFSSCGFGIFHKIGVKKYITILGGSVGSFSDTLLGVKNHPSYIPGMMAGTTDQMGFFDRIRNFFTYFMEKAFMGSMFTKAVEEAIQMHFPEFNINVSLFSFE
uniref:glucuronosyltransferase n=1 Tax=Panagrolaimus davidi TaxID=227884 RepID=A0A914R4C6_9BILA